MGEETGAPVLAAVDGTEGSLRALDWAADEALRRGRRLRIVYAFDWPVYHTVPAGIPDFSMEDFARRVVEHARSRALERAPDLRTEAEFEVGDAAPILLLAAAEAELAVIGSRGRSRLRAVLLGSTGMELAATARCPVVVVPDREPKPDVGRVVVGLDGSPAARAAAAWSFATAAERGAALRAVTVHARVSSGRLGSLEVPARYAFDSAEEAAAAEEARRMQSESLAGRREHYPQVDVEEVVEGGHPARVLVDAAEDADLLVVGSRGREGFTGMLMGSVSQSVLSHSAVPVAVLRAEKH
ncbi:universal stress protein [Streptomonospora wellingtoniae]|uniref:Universal stress protein n=1 Tax=Streptomonospora wellingtoniae TaxID=3075544 RepID=A0ABU2L030_9ACTN|nr:universal stress protein [Streptomonospora sp. DSM 45055]MDT0304922.1 universal stress protein [Streptomonospora sp. DSM 45055]